jgi:pimeloyl-ACP methyl ester carboxylesterase
MMAAFSTSRFLRSFGPVRSILPAAALLWLAASIATADGPADNIPTEVRRVPKLGVEVPADVRAELETGLADLKSKIDALRNRKDEKTAKLLPDVEIYHKAVRDALDHQEFFDAREFAVARRLIGHGRDRAVGLEIGNPTWTRAKGLVVRGYRSKIDGSVQPVGVVVPESYDPFGPARHRTDIWFHGRGETLSELAFVNQRQTQPGQFTPPDTFVIHPYGRYCNAAKLAGEVDAYEALDLVRDQYRVDDDRVSVRGFSMGGASAWHFAAHNPTAFVAANPGAGFSETPKFLRDFQREVVQPTWWERKLFRMYDCNDWAENFRLIPTVAYSGEIDNQKQAADVMAEALAKVGIELTHIIGPKTGHKYEPAAAAEVERRMAAIARRGRDRVPTELTFVTYTLRYPTAAWLTITGLGEHWEKAEVNGKIEAGYGRIRLTTKNVTSLAIAFGPGDSPFDSTPEVIIDDVALTAGPLQSDRSWSASFHKSDSGWKAGPVPSETLAKKPGLQGPVDDAFLDAFLFVAPSGTAAHPKVDAWTKAEMDRARIHWRQHFRGVAPVKKDTEVTDEDIRTKNLILWGDAKSNTLIARMAEKLPVKTAEGKLTVGKQSFDSADHAAILIYPNPENPARYVVLNSGFTFRDYAHLNNARQIPKLPDWAIVDLNTPPNAVWPGKVVAADFFDERWQVKPTVQPAK